MTEKNARDYYTQIDNWCRSDRLAQETPTSPAKITGNQWLLAGEAFADIDWKAFAITPERIEALDAWCKAWLSEYGWKRLQSNVRQKRRVVKLKTVQFEYDAWERLARYAEMHQLTMSAAVFHLFDRELERLEEANSFKLEHDRYVWKCSKCHYIIEAESEDHLSNMQDIHTNINVAELNQ